MASFIKKHKFDIIIIGILSVLALTFVIVFYALKTDGQYVTVTVNKVKTEKYSLNINGEYKLGNDDNFNILVIKDGFAYIKEASCPDKLCVHQGKVKSNGEQLICLPNKVIITVTSDSKSETDF